MPRARTLAASLLAVLLAPALAGAAETRTFEAQNFRLTPPSDSWQWMEVNSDMEKAGYVATIARRHESTVALVHLRVQPQSDPPLSIEELTAEVRDGLAASLSSNEGTRVDRGKLSGLDGSLVIVKGKNNRDEPTLVRAYTILARNRFHQMIFILVNGAETKQAVEVEALRRSYRLLDGAGPEEPPSADLPSHEGGEAPAGTGEGTAALREGQTLTFPSHNLKWNLPEGSPFEWTVVTLNEQNPEQMLARAEARIPLPPPAEKPPEGSPPRPEANIARVDLHVYPPQEGWTPQRYVNDMGLRGHIEQNAFDRVEYGRTKAIDDLDIGNVPGAALQMVGTKEGAVVVVRKYAVLLKGKIYIWHVLLAGDRTVDDEFSKPLQDLVAGVEFLDTTVWVRGPLAIPGVPDHDQDRGSGRGEEKEVASLGFKADKPAEMSALSFEPQYAGGNLRLAWEVRSEDKQSYLYFDLQSWTKSSLRGTRDYAEQMIRQRETLWKEHAQSASTIAKGKEAWFKAKWGKASGLGYEFKGYLGDAPFVEEGYVVEYKDWVYWVRVQYGGKDAEKALTKTAKALVKAVRFG